MNQPTNTTDNCPITKNFNNMSLTDHKEDCHSRLDREFTSFSDMDLTNVIKQMRPFTHKNVPERIVLVIDSMEQPKLANEDHNKMLLCNLKNALNIFVSNKLVMNKEHEFAVLVIKNKSCSMQTEFNNNHKAVINQINQISECLYKDEDKFPLDSIFQKINELLNVKHNSYIRPTRVILFYAREAELGVYDTNISKDIIENENLIIDAVFIIPKRHSKDIERLKRCFQSIQALSFKGQFEHCLDESGKDLSACIMKMLAHPFQRSVNSEKNYSIHESLKLSSDPRKKQREHLETSHTYM